MTIKQFITKESPDFVSLALDGWSVHHHGYMGAIASSYWNKWTGVYFFSSSDYITPDWQRQALVLGCVPFAERHNSENIANWIVKELDDWKLISVTEMIVSDTASNQLGIFNADLAPDLPRHFQPSRCSCHILQLCIGDCILCKPNIARIVKDCRYGGLIEMPYLLFNF